ITPRLHNTLLSVGVVGHVPPEADADTNVTGALPLPAARLSEKATFDVVSPVFVTVYVKLSWLPALAEFAVGEATVRLKLRVGPNLKTNMPAGPLNVAWIGPG